MLKKLQSFAWAPLCAVLYFCFTLPASGQVGPLIRNDVHHDVSPALRDLPVTPRGHDNAESVDVEHEAEPARRIPLPPGLNSPDAADPVHQRTAAAALEPQAPSVGQSFEGLGNGFLGFAITGAPPDTNGAVGLTQYVQWVNRSFAVFDKATGNLVSGPTDGNSLWTGFGGGCEADNDGDPIVLFDKLANRWVLSQFSVHSTPFLQCVAVSTTPDATGTYNRYAFSYSNFDDYPKMGAWPDAYYVTFNMFNGNTFVGADACAYDRTAMLTGQRATQVCFQQGSSVGGLLPSDLDGSRPPPAGSPNFLVFFGSNNLNLFRFHVDFATPANSTFTGPTVIPVAAFSPLCGGGTCVPQPGVIQQLDSLADRLMYRLAYRNFGTHESLVVNHSVVAGGSGGVRWYELQNPSGSVTLAQQSTFAPDSNFRWMGSIAMDKAGDMAMGYSISSSVLNPSIAFTGRLASDPTNTMQAENVIITGTGAQSGGNLSRWGDYSAMQIDPVDDCTFWYTTEYMRTTGAFNWNTHIANFSFPNCVSIPDFTLSSSPASVALAPGNSGTSTITVNPTNGFNSNVALSVSGLPSGVTASLSPASTTGTSTLTFTASPTAARATSLITLTGTSGALTHITTISLSVNAPDYTLSALPASLTVIQGNSGTGTITVNPTNGFTGNVALSASGLPSGVTASFSPASTTGTSTLTLSASSTATTGTVIATVTGTSGALIHTTNISLTVTPPPDYTLSASPASLTVVQGNSGLSAITVSPTNGFNGSVAFSASGLPNGVTASFSPASTTGSSTLTLSTSPMASPGTATITVTGTSGALTHTTTISLTVIADFTLTASPVLPQVAPGSSVVMTITVIPTNDFHGSIALSVDPSFLPSGVTASFNPASTTGTSTLTLSASAAFSTGFFVDVPVVGTSGALTHQVLILLRVQPPPPDYTLSASPANLAVVQGNSGTSTVTISPTNGFNGSVALSASGLPNGVTASFNPTSTTGTSTMTFSASPTATTGTASITVTGTSGGLTHTTTIGLTVTPSSTPDYTLSASPASFFVVQGNSGTSTITVGPTNGFSGSVALSASGLPAGVTASFNPSSTTGSSTVTFSASPTATLGTAPITITGTSGTLTHTTTVSIVVSPPPDYTLSSSLGNIVINQGNSRVTSISVNPTNGFNSSVAFSASGMPSGVTASFNPASATGGSALTLSASPTAALGTATITVTGTSGALTHTTTINLNVIPPPDFTLSGSPGNLTVIEGSSGTTTITVNPTNGFNNNVALSASGLPSGITASFNPPSPNPADTTMGMSTLTLSASPTATTGTATITVTGTSGSLTHTTTITLTVNPGPDYTLSASPASLTVVQGNSGTSTITVGPANGFTGNVALSASGLPSGVTARFNPTSTTGTSTLTLSASPTATTGTATITVTGASGSLTHTTTVSLTIPGPDYTLTNSLGTAFVNQGNNLAATITVVPSNGFNSSVALSISGLPSGVTASFNPASASPSAASTLTLSASPTATLGTALITVTGSSGSLTHTTNISLTVNAPPDYTLSASPTSLTLVQGNSGTSTITVSPTNGFNGNVVLSASGLPAGVTASFNPATTTGTSTLTLSSSATATTGTATITVTGTSGALTHTTTISLTVNAPPDYTLSASPTSLTLVQGNSGTSTITVGPTNGFNGSVALSASGLPPGVTASFNPSSTTGTSTLTLSSSATATTGTATITVTGTSGALTHTTTISLTVNAPPDYTLSASVGNLVVQQGNSGTATITINPSNGFSGAVALSISGLPAGVTGNFNPASTTGTSTLTLTTSATAITGATTTLTITGTSGSLTRSTNMNLTVTAPPADYSLSASPTSLTIVQGSTGSTTIAVTPTNGFNGSVALSASGLPNGVTASFNPASTTGTSTLTFSASPTATTGTATITVTGTSGGLTHTTTISLTLNPPPDYTLSASPASLTVVQGNSGTSNITVGPTNGFNGIVALSASGLPSGVTASFTPASAMGTSTLTLSANPTANTGTATITVTGASGTLTHTTTISLTVNAAPDYTLSASPANLTLVQGNSGTSTITVSPTNGFNGSVALSTSGLPSGVTASFNPASATGTSTLTLSATPTATTGTATITVTGTSGTLAHTTTISLIVSANEIPQLLGNPGFENGADPTPWTLTPAVINNDPTFEPPHSGAWDAWLDGYGISHTDSATQTVTIPAGVASATLTFWLHVDTAETTTTAANDVLSVQVLDTSGNLLATLGTFSNLDAAAGYQQHSFSVLNFAGQTVQIQFIGIEDNDGLQTSFVIDDTSLEIPQLLGNPGFESGADPTPWTLTPAVINNDPTFEPPHSGAWDAWLDGYGISHTDSATQTVTIPAGITSATLSFWLHVDTAETTTTAANDVLSVQVLDTSGNVLATLGWFSNLDAAPGYQPHSFSMANFIGQTVQIQFIGSENDSLQTSFVIDDTALIVQ